MKVLGKITEAIRVIFRGTDRTVTIDPNDSFPLSGTVAISGSTVTGSATAFETEIAAAGASSRYIDVSGTIYQLASIGSDTVLTITTSTTVGAGATIKLVPDGDSTLTVPEIGAVTDEITTNAATQALTNKTLTSPTITTMTVDTVSLDGAKIVETDKTQVLTNKTIGDSGDPTKETAFDNSAITTGTTRTVTLPDADVNITPQGSSFHTIVTTDAELVAALLVGGTIGINANITNVTPYYTVGVAGTEIYGTDAKFAVTGLAGEDTVFKVTVDECVIRNLEIVTKDATMRGVDATTTDKGQYSDLTITMDATYTASAIYIDGSYNRVTNLLADSSGGAITGVELAAASTDNLVSGVIVT